MRRSRGRGHERPRRARSIAWSAPRLSGPSVMRCSRSRLQGPLEAEDDLPAAIGPVGEHEADRLVSEAADGENEGRNRRSVEPLDVVHDEKHGPAARALAKEGKDRRRHGTLVERCFRLLPQQRDGQRTPLGTGKLCCLLVVGLLEEIPERSE